jgi:acetylornithine aminotransferase
VRPSPVLQSLAQYPFTRLTEAKRRLAAEGVEIVDFGIGEPREETPAFLREAVGRLIEPRSSYPLAEGLPELRSAVTAWVSRRFGVELDPESEVIPTLGSKEAIFHLAQVLDGELVAVTTPGYPVPARGALFAGKQVLEIPLLAENGFLPDLDAVPAETWARVGLLWLNYPNNPTAAVAPLSLYERAATLAREHDFVLASDEAYSEIYFGDDPPVSVLQIADRTNVLALNTLSKRSAMAGFRCGFLAGDPAAIGLLRRYRPNVGVAPQDFIQRLAALAWADEAHVDDMRAIYRSKRDVLLEALRGIGVEHAGGDATMFLWLAEAEHLVAPLLELGVVLAPGSFFGAGGEGFARLALVPTPQECERAAEIIATLPRPASTGATLPRPASHGEDLPRPASHGEDLPRPASHGEDLPRPASHGEDLRSRDD